MLWYSWVSFESHGMLCKAVRAVLLLHIYTLFCAFPIALLYKEQSGSNFTCHVSLYYNSEPAPADNYSLVITCAPWLLPLPLSWIHLYTRFPHCHATVLRNVLSRISSDLSLLGPLFYKATSV